MPVARRPLLIFTVLAALWCAPACTRTHGPETKAPELSAPANISDLDDYAAARNAYALLSIDDPARASTRASLRDYLVGYVDHALDREQLDAAIEGLEQLAGLWLAVELRSVAAEPELARVSERVYAAAAANGDERPALLALGLAQAFGDAEQRARAEAGYAQLSDWLARTQPYADDPRVLVELDRLLEHVTARLPSPFLVQSLATVYLTRYRDAQQSGSSFGSGDPRIPFTGYLLARVYLRADDFDSAIAALDRIPGDGATADLRDLIADVVDPELRSPASFDQLIFEFLPLPNDRLPPEIVAQSWGIIDNLARRSLARFPDHPPAQLARGRVLRSRNHVDAAIIYYERSFAAKTRPTAHEDLFRAWSELAELYQLSLEAHAEAGAAVDEVLARLEKFHVRAIETWPQRPIEPGVALAWMTVAVAEFDAGHIERAQALMEQTVAIDPQPAALSLLGTIAMRRGQFDDARGYLTRLAKLSDRLPDQLDRYNWMIDAKQRLAEVEMFAGAQADSRASLREALRQLNTLLSYPGLNDALRAEFTLRRANVFFMLGELGFGMDDARVAQQLAPDRQDTLSEPLLFTVVHGHYQQALELLSTALARGDLRELGVYYSLWVGDLAARQGLAVPKLASDHLRAYAADDDAPAWQRKLARFGLGELAYDKLLAAADTPRERAEAHFYEGLQRWRNGSHAAGLELMREVLAQNMMGDFEYQMAQSYVRWNELPKTAKAALGE